MKDNPKTQMKGPAAKQRTYPQAPPDESTARTHGWPVEEHRGEVTDHPIPGEST
jgi:hypothetical protein